MNKGQWFLFSIGFMLLGILFIEMDMDPLNCDPYMKINLDEANDIFDKYLNGEITKEERDEKLNNNNWLESRPLDTTGVWCIMNSEMFDPFIWLLFPLSGLFFICGLLEPKKK